MRILMDLINFPKGGGQGVDWRYSILKDIGKYLQSVGHKIYAKNIVGVDNPPFEKWKNQDCDYYICHTPYGNQAKKSRRELFLRANKPVTVYDHGWLFKSLIVDRQLLFGDSYYRHKIKHIIETEYPNPENVDSYRQELLQSNISKRPQAEIDLIPELDYVFIPGQVLYDCSIVYYSRTGLLDFIQKVTEWAAQRNIHVVYKPHPGLLDFASHGRETLEHYAEQMKQKFPHFHIINNSIYKLMLHSKFTACINCGSIVDNLISNTPVYCCGESFFCDSGAVVYNPDIEIGLDTMLTRSYNWEEMKLQQKRMLFWLKDNLIQQHLSPIENIKRLEKHSGVKLT